ncbi:hypothetical protein [Xenorhabdus bovienii]|uniref:hypothetical protein n=1 Tax=Xenorhabdus bovienii TaxID=40576 RepID=UPI00237C74C4|nr:hypothetical protein [Xenorhabdus bovienii]MDE1476354.1 hypothetical protein [Xenorhabdus bovienii]
MVNNIDVTLRDGGYLNNFNFTTEYAINHVETLTKSGMEWFEIGYRNGSFKPISNIGLTGMSPDSYIWDIHRAVPEAKVLYQEWGKAPEISTWKAGYHFSILAKIANNMTLSEYLLNLMNFNPIVFLPHLDAILSIY